MIILLASGIKLITLNRPPKKKSRNVAIRTYAKESEIGAHVRLFLKALIFSHSLLIIHILDGNLKQRLRSYKNISQRFDLFFHLKTLHYEKLKQSYKEFPEIYYEDANEKELEMECQHSTDYLKIGQIIIKMKELIVC